MIFKTLATALFAAFMFLNISHSHAEETLFEPISEFAGQGNAKAQFNLGWMYDNGEGVTQNDKKAVEWFTKAAGQGDAEAQYNLGVMYANGRGVTQDDKKAVEWFTKAAGQGDAGAQFNLGVMYDNGEGVTQDYVRAHMWFNIAASNSSDEDFRHKTRTGMRRASDEITSSQIERAQEMARKCLSSNYKNC